MCGIYLSNLSVSDKDHIKRFNKISFRGPDNFQIIKKDNIYIGHLRLSIIDLDKRSNQPFEKNNCLIVFNGEIYNYKKIKKELKKYGYSFITKSDTEVLLTAYLHWGEKMLNRLEGMFAFSIYDRNKKIIFSARDRLGQKPFYYHFKNGNIEICSQLKPISKNKNISIKALSIYYDLGYVPSPYSIYKDVYKLKAGNYLIIDLKKNKLLEKSYWDLKKSKIDNHINYNYVKKKVKDLIRNSIDKRLISDVPLGFFLSSGVDSSLIASLLSNKSKKKSNFFTIGFNEKKYDESIISYQISKKLKINQTIKYFTNEDIFNEIEKHQQVFDEPFADSTTLPTLLLSKLVKNKISVAITGDAGDESFFGYNHFKWLRYFNLMTYIPLHIRKIISFLLSKINKLVNNKRLGFISKIILYKNNYDFIKSIFLGIETLAKNKDESWFNDHYEKYLFISNNYFQSAADLNIKLWLENDSNVKTDRSSMAYSLEIRSPLIDHKLIEYCRLLPVNYRFDKKLLKDILYELDLKKSYFENKKGFSVPIKEWSRSYLKDRILNKLNDEFLNSLPNFNHIKFKKMIDDHFSYKSDYSYFIWRIFMLSLWFDKNEKSSFTYSK
tara:strand:+ start:22598 stop:24424 length:1827 start_codon:yes stop_codon:yes gene_type:complete